MRIFNGTKSQVTLPYAGGQRISISPMSVSANIGPTDELIALIVTAYRDDELAIIVSGPYELATASRNPVAVSYLVQTVDEAIRKFAPKEEPKVEKKEEPKPVKAEPAKTVEEAPAEPEVVVETKAEEPKEAEKVEEPSEQPKKRGRGRPRKNA